MKILKAIGLLLMLLFAVSFVNAQTNTLSPVVYEGRMGVQVEMTDLDAADEDSTTFVDWTPFNTSTISYLIQSMTSARVAVQDTFTVYVMGYMTSLSAPIYMDTIAFTPATGITSAVGSLSISSSIITPYVGFRVASANAPADRRLFIQMSGAYVTAVTAADIRARYNAGRYGTTQ